MSSHRLRSAAIFLSALTHLLCADGNAAPPLIPAPAAGADPLPCLHPTSAAPPTPGEGNAARSALPLAAVGKRWTLYSLGVNAINAWARADDGRVWLATGRGVKCVDEKSSTVRHDTLQGGSGLPAENVTAIVTAENGDVWCFATKPRDSSRRSYYLCRLGSGQTQWKTIRTFDLPILPDDDSDDHPALQNRPGLLASGHRLSVALPGEEHGPLLLLWDGEVWKDVPIPAEIQSFRHQFSDSYLSGVSLVSLNDTHQGVITSTGFHLLRLPSAPAAPAPAAAGAGETMFATLARGQTVLAATPASRPARAGSGYWVAVHTRPVRDGFGRQDENAPRPVAARWNLVRVMPGGGGATTMAPAPQPAGGVTGESDSPPHSLALHATDDGTKVWVAVTYEDNDRVEAQILRFDTERGTWKVMLTVAPGSSPARVLDQSEGTPGRTPEDWGGIPMEMAAHLACYGNNFPSAPYHAAFQTLPAWYCPPQPLPEWPRYKGESIAKARTDGGDTWSIETRKDGRVLSRRSSTATPDSAPERFAAPPAPPNPRPPIRGLAATPDGKLLVATDLSVQRFTPNRKRWEHVPGAAADLLGPGTRLLTAAGGDAVWVAGIQEVARLDAPPDRRQATGWRLKVIGTRPDGGLWLADSTSSASTLASSPPRLFQINGAADAPAAMVPVAPHPAPRTIDPGTAFFAATGNVVWCSPLLRSSSIKYDNCLLGYDTRAGKWLPPLKVISTGQFPVWRAEDGYYYAVVSSPEGDAMFGIDGAAGRWERVALIPDDPDRASDTPAPTTVWQRQARGLTFVSADRRRFWFHHGLGVVWEFDR